MYKILNKTSKKILFYGNEVEPNNEVVVCNSIFDAKSFKDEELGACEITSQYGEHSCDCSGNMTCTPKTGKDGTVFTISEKKQ